MKTRTIILTVLILSAGAVGVVGWRSTAASPDRSRASGAAGAGLPDHQSRLVSGALVASLPEGGGFAAAAVDQVVPVTAGSAVSSASMPVRQGVVRPAGEVVSLPMAGLTDAGDVTRERLCQVRILPEPLVPAGDSEPREDARLGEALRRYASGDAWDVTPLEAYVADHVSSPWRVSLRLNMGLVLVQHGFPSRAMDAFRLAWEEGADFTDPALSAQVDRAIGEYAILNAWVGRFDELDRIQSVTAQRNIQGVGATKLYEALQGRQSMRSYPEASFKCGPFAIQRILVQAGLLETRSEARIEAYPSTSEGTSLAQVSELAAELGLPMQAARWSSGAPLVLPAVMHWRLNHFSAVLSERDGRVLVEDRTMDQFYGRQRWIPVAALREEASGAFLVPAGPLPSGWTAISRADQGRIWGKGDAGSGGDATGECDDKDGGDGGCGSKGMARYTFHLMMTSLNIVDTPLSYEPPKGMPIEVRIGYTERENRPTTVYTTTNFGSKWTCNWIGGVLDLGQRIVLATPGGGNVVYFMNGQNESSREAWSGSVMRRVSPTRYEVTYRDQRREIYAQPDGAGAAQRVWLSQIIDRFGHTVTLDYEAAGPGVRLTAITDAVGQMTTFAYGHADPLRPTRITDPFGRAAQLTYTSYGNLASITDPVGIVSSFEYKDLRKDIVTGLRTPYGLTTFRRGGGTGRNSRWIEAIDPQGDVERAEFVIPTNVRTEGLDELPADIPGEPRWVWSELQNGGYLHARNTYYWDKKAMRLAPGDYNQATQYHWLHNARELTNSRILESIKPAGSARVCYIYPGQTTTNEMLYDDTITVAKPRIIARRRDDGSTKITRLTYAANGTLTSYTDPVGRRTDFLLASNGVDVAEVRQSAPGIAPVVVVQSTFTPSGKVASLRHPDGTVTRYAYDAEDRVSQVTMRDGDIAAFRYDERGYLTELFDVGRNMMTARWTHDRAGRIQTVTDRDGRVTTIAYDDLDRPIRYAKQDGTFVEYVWDRMRIGTIRDHVGRATSYRYNALQQVIGVIDAGGNLTKYEWCKCGQLQGMTDALGQVTRWTYDVSGRLVAKHSPGGRVQTIAYEPLSGRPSIYADGLGQEKHVNYTPDGRVAAVRYVQARHPTPDVVFTYDALFGRLESVTDGQGLTQLAYQGFPAVDSEAETPVWVPGAGRVAAIDGPLADDTVVMAYDAQSRLIQRQLGSDLAMVIGYDDHHRVSTMTSAMGMARLGYDGSSARIRTLELPLGMRVDVSYGPVAEDLRVTGMRYAWNEQAVPRVQDHRYTWDAGGRLAQWSIAQDAGAPSVMRIEHDALDRTVAVQRTAGAGLSGLEESFRYDAMGNRSVHQQGMAIRSYAVSSNQTVGRSSAGLARVEGTISEPGSVQVNGVPAQVRPDLTWVGYVEITPGRTSLDVTAQDLRGNAIATRWQTAEVPAEGAATWTFDGNGNTLRDATRSYTWDAENRLVAIDGPGDRRSEFAYNATSHLVHQVERVGGTIVEERRYIWSGDMVVQERDGSGAIIRRYYGFGEIEGDDKRLYVRDHLGSVREVINAAGQRLAQYDYDTFGVRTTIFEAPGYTCRMGYAGLMHHAPSALAVAHHRFYDPTIGRWLNQDPIAERGGMNLYAYVGNRPLEHSDPSGLVATSDLAIDEVISQVVTTVVVMAVTAPVTGAANGIEALAENWPGPPAPEAFDPNPIGPSAQAAGHAADTFYAKAKRKADATDADCKAAKSAPRGAGGWEFKPGRDLDWRGSGKTHNDAIDEAFKRTGVPRDQFEVTKWGKDAHGKSHPVEWRAKGGAEVNIDWPHVKNGPAEPHVGCQTPGKGNTTGHIILDDVPYNR